MGIKLSVDWTDLNMVRSAKLTYYFALMGVETGVAADADDGAGKTAGTACRVTVRLGDVGT